MVTLLLLTLFGQHPPEVGSGDIVPEADTARLIRRLEQLEGEVREVHALRDRVEQLEGELSILRAKPEGVAPPVPAAGLPSTAAWQGDGPRLGDLIDGGGVTSGDFWIRPGRADGGERRRAGEQGPAGGEADDGGRGYGGGAGSGTLSTGGGGGAGPNDGGQGQGGSGQGSVGRGERVGEREPLSRRLNLEYQYNFAGGYFSLFDDDREFVLNVQNIIVTDGTFYDRQNAPTEQKGFNVPFQRLYLYGNITKNWEFQVSEQATLGNFNLLDLLVNVHYDDRLMLKVGRFLSPFYYQDYATFPMLVPTINYSPLFQFSGQRQVGAMAWGKLFENRIQYQAGIFNGIPNGWSDFDDNRDFIASVSMTPFIRGDRPWLQNLGVGVSMETGWQNYLLSDPSRQDLPEFPSIAGSGAPELNRRYVTTSGIPFFVYNRDVRALGQRTRIAPHLFWYGRASILAEYVHQDRALADASQTRGVSVQRGFYVQGSYFLTGERNTGDGTGGFPTIIPNRPFNPTRGEYGIGAWELAFQFGHLNVGTGDIHRGFAEDIWATRLNEIQCGVNWWPNKYTRLSVDWVHDAFNRPIPWPIHGNEQQDTPVNFVRDVNIAWIRLAMFF